MNEQRPAHHRPNQSLLCRHCDYTSSPPWPAMVRLHAGGPNRYYVCPKCCAIREDVYQGGAIVDHQWHDAPDGTLPKAVRVVMLGAQLRGRL
jgi:hypothetical protein